MVDGLDTGCLLKVAKADAGSKVWFKLRSTLGERKVEDVKLNAGKTSGYKLFYLEDSKRYQANFTGTVSYDGALYCGWPFKVHDPSAKTTFEEKYEQKPGFYWRNIRDRVLPKTPRLRDGTITLRSVVPVGEGKSETIFTYYDPDSY